MNLLGKKRLLIGAGGIATVAAAGTLIAGTTLGVFTASTSSGSNSFTAGTVTLSQGASTTCTVTHMVPGDQSGVTAGDSACTLVVTYTGNAPAWMALDVSIGGTGLYDSSSTGLHFTITDNQGSPVTYMSGTTLGGSATSGTTPSATNLLVKTGTFANGDAVTFTVNYSLPIGAGNTYQGLNSTLSLTAHAVQSGNNGSTSGCTAGQVCAGVTSW
jgi:predicted ribosomally synthesized peptide with SipW-like signal peptide